MKKDITNGNSLYPMRKDITNCNSKGQFHGYQELYWFTGDLLSRHNYKNNQVAGFREYYNWINGTLHSLRFHII